MVNSPSDRSQVLANVSSFLNSANTGPQPAGAQPRKGDPLIAVLQGLTDGPRSVPHLAKQTGLGLSELSSLLEKLESMRMVRRQEEASRFVFSLESEGIAMLGAML